jgi:hypothetical protein
MARALAVHGKRTTSARQAQDRCRARAKPVRDLCAVCRANPFALSSREIPSSTHPIPLLILADPLIHFHSSNAATTLVAVSRPTVCKKNSGVRNAKQDCGR